MNKSKSTMLILLFTVLIMCACANNEKQISVGMSFEEIAKIERNYAIGPIRVYRWNQDYQIITLDGMQTVKSSIEFTFDRKSYNQQNIEPLKERSDWQRFIGMSINEVEAELGEFHCNIGAGQYAPAYIMEDAYLIYFDSVVPPEGNTNGEGIVTRVTKLDLFATKTTIVEKYE